MQEQLQPLILLEGGWGWLGISSPMSLLHDTSVIYNFANGFYANTIFFFPFLLLGSLVLSCTLFSLLCFWADFTQDHGAIVGILCQCNGLCTRNKSTNLSSSGDSVSGSKEEEERKKRRPFYQSHHSIWFIFQVTRTEEYHQMALWCHLFEIIEEKQPHGQHTVEPKKRSLTDRSALDLLW